MRRCLHVLCGHMLLRSLLHLVAWGVPSLGHFRWHRGWKRAGVAYAGEGAFRLLSAPWPESPLPQMPGETRAKVSSC